MESFSVYKYLAIFGRHRWAYIFTTIALLAASLTYSYRWSVYKASAQIQIVQPDIPEGMTVPIGTDSSTLIEAFADQQIQDIYQAVTATPSLVEIIKKIGLYPKERDEQSLAGFVGMLRSKLKIRLVNSDFSTPGAPSRSPAGHMASLTFQITFAYTEPLETQKFLNELVARIMEEDLKKRQKQSQATLNLLDSQLHELETSMAAQEKTIADFRSKSADSGPASLAMNQQGAMTTFISVQNVQSQLSALEKSQGDLRTQLAGVDPYSRVVDDGQVLTTPTIQLKALQAKYATISAQYGPLHPDVVKLRHQIEALQATVGGSSDTGRLQSVVTDLKANLAAATQTYGPKHPDVLALSRQLTAAEQALARSNSLPFTGGGSRRDADNPAYIMVMSQIHANDAQYRALISQRASLQQQYDKYQQAIAQSPANEQAIASLSRDYENSQLRYRDLKQKRQTASMTQQMETNRDGARLAVVELPEVPGGTSPSKSFLFMASILASFAGGFGGVLVTEVLSRNVHGTDSLTDILGEPPMIVVPYLVTPGERRLQFFRRVMVAATILLLMVGGLIAVNDFVTPLDAILPWV